MFIQLNQVTAFCMCKILTIYSDVLQLFLELGLDLGEAFQQKGIECAAFPVQDHPHGSLVGERLFVAALTGQGVVHIGQGDDLRADGDVIALEAVRVAPAIPALMVPAGDVVGGLQQGFMSSMAWLRVMFWSTAKPSFTGTLISSNTSTMAFFLAFAWYIRESARWTASSSGSAEPCSTAPMLSERCRWGGSLGGWSPLY